jgi:hypothetical protein
MNSSFIDCFAPKIFFTTEAQRTQRGCFIVGSGDDDPTKALRPVGSNFTCSVMYREAAVVFPLPLLRAKEK